MELVIFHKAINFRGMSVEDNLLSIVEINEKDKNKQNIILQNPLMNLILIM